MSGKLKLSQNVGRKKGKLLYCIVCKKCGKYTRYEMDEDIKNIDWCGCKKDGQKTI